MSYIERGDIDTYYLYNDGRIVGEPFTTGWAVKWYGRKVLNLGIGERMNV